MLRREKKERKRKRRLCCNDTKTVRFTGLLNTHVWRVGFELLLLYGAPLSAPIDCGSAFRQQRLLFYTAPNVGHAANAGFPITKSELKTLRRRRQPPR